MRSPVRAVVALWAVTGVRVVVGVLIAWIITWIITFWVLVPTVLVPGVLAGKTLALSVRLRCGDVLGLRILLRPPG